MITRKGLLEMELHAELKEKNMTIVRVIDGWIYAFYFNAMSSNEQDTWFNEQYTPVFVPDPHRVQNVEIDR